MTTTKCQTKNILLLSIFYHCLFLMGTCTTSLVTWIAPISLSSMIAHRSFHLVTKNNILMDESDQVILKTLQMEIICCNSFKITFDKIATCCVLIYLHNLAGCQYFVCIIHQYTVLTPCKDSHIGCVMSSPRRTVWFEISCPITNKKNKSTQSAFGKWNWTSGLFSFFHRFHFYSNSENWENYEEKMFLFS